MRKIIPEEKFHRLTVIKKAPSKGYITMVECKCDCGQVVIRNWTSVWMGSTKSCGCLRKEIANSFPSAKKKVYDNSKLEPYH